MMAYSIAVIRQQSLTSIGFLIASAGAFSRSTFLLFSTRFFLLGFLLGNARATLLLWGGHGLRPDLRLQDSHRKRLREKERGEQYQLSAYDATQAARGKLTRRTFAPFARNMSLR